MKVLFLAHRIPYPPNKGDKIRAFQELRALNRHGHEVHLVAFADDRADLQFVANLHETCATVTVLHLKRRVAAARALLGLAGRQPLTVRYFSSTAMRAVVRRLVADVQPDVVLVYSSSMAQYVPRHLADRTMVDLVDADSEKWRECARLTRPPTAWVYALEWRRLRACERAIVRDFACAVVTTPREAALLFGPEASPATLHAIANGVDLGRFRPAEQGPRRPEPLPQDERKFFERPARHRLVFTGRMDYYANVDGIRYFVREIFPAITAEEPETELLIVGSSPTRDVTALGAYPGVIVTGAVREIHPYLASSLACVVPLRVARGIQNKVLEAMACGLPVVATPAAVAGLQVMAGRDVLVAAAPAQFAGTVIDLLRDQRMREEIGRRARQFVETHHNWDLLLEPFVKLLEAVVEPGLAARRMLSPPSGAAVAVAGRATPLAGA